MNNIWPQNKDGITIYNQEAFLGMHEAGRLAAEVLDMIGEHVVPGVSTEALDALCHDYMVERGATPATLGYRGFPASSCISLNHVICHGIPGDKTLKDGDILNIDVTVILNGWHGDNSRMYVAGTPSIKAKRLLQVTHDALMLGIEASKPGNTFNDIGVAIQTYVEKYGFSVVRDFCGHGLGHVFHSAPNVLHYGTKGFSPVIEEGMIFTIEPMVNLGKHEAKILSDGWTAVTRDRSLSAQYEHSLGIKADGPEIFTNSPLGLYEMAFKK